MNRKVRILLVTTGGLLGSLLSWLLVQEWPAIPYGFLGGIVIAAAIVFRIIDWKSWIVIASVVLGAFLGRKWVLEGMVLGAFVGILLVGLIYLLFLRLVSRSADEMSRRDADSSLN